MDRTLHPGAGEHTDDESEEEYCKRNRCKLCPIHCRASFMLWFPYPCGPDPLPPSKQKDAFAGDAPSAKASEVSDTPSETPEAGRGYEPPVSSDDYLRGSLLLPFSMGDLRNNPMGCLGVRFLPYPITFVKPKLYLSRGRSRGKSEP